MRTTPASNVSPHPPFLTHPQREQIPSGIVLMNLSAVFALKQIVRNTFCRSIAKANR